MHHDLRFYGRCSMLSLKSEKKEYENTRDPYKKTILNNELYCPKATFFLGAYHEFKNGRFYEIFETSPILEIFEQIYRYL